MRTTLILGLVSLFAATFGFLAPYLAIKFLPANEPAQVTPASSRPAFIPFGESVVNLDEGRLTRYLRVNITLLVDEMDVQAITKDTEKKKPILKSWLLSYLSSKGMEDIRGEAGQNRVRREIHDYFNSVLFPDGEDKIQDVLFEEFNIQ